jgi:hypothetical protein
MTAPGASPSLPPPPPSGYLSGVPPRPDLAVYHQTVRQTIQGLDNLILTIVLQGSLFLIAFLGFAGWVGVREAQCIGPVNVTKVAAIAVSALTGVLGWFLHQQLRMYIWFLRKAVDICARLENTMLPRQDDEIFHLTRRFEEHPTSGGKGKRLFPIPLFALILLAAGAGIYFYSGLILDGGGTGRVCPREATQPSQRQ